MTTVQFPLNEVQLTLLRLTENLSGEELNVLKQLIIAFKAQRLAESIDKVWDEKGWSEVTMQEFLKTHMRTPYLSAQQNKK